MGREGDASQVENAVLNLAINARDAMPVGGRLVIEDVERERGQGLRATQLGEAMTPGIRAPVDLGHGNRNAAEILARAFEPFFTTKEPGKGTGLGLASIYGFARQSGGHVTIYSEPGAGTTVNSICRGP